MPQHRARKAPRWPGPDWRDLFQRSNLMAIFNEDPGTDGDLLDLANEAAAEGLYELAAEYLEEFNALLEAEK